MSLRLHCVPILLAFGLGIGITNTNGARILEKFEQWKNQGKTVLQKGKLLYMAWRRFMYKNDFDSWMKSEDLRLFADTVQIIVDNDVHALINWLKSGKHPESLKGKALEKIISQNSIIPVIVELKKEFEKLKRDENGLVVL